jgi:hypothetical protein
MSSENGENKKRNENLNDFLAEGAEERSGENHRIRNTVEKIEKEIEKLGRKVYYLSDRSVQKQNYLFKLIEYIDEAKSELRFYRRIRFFMIGVSLGFVAFLQALLICVIFFHQFFFFLQGPYFRSALVLATIGGSVVIISLVLRGVFRMAAEQSAEHQMPQEMRGMLNTANTITQSQTG